MGGEVPRLGIFLMEIRRSQFGHSVESVWLQAIRLCLYSVWFLDSKDELKHPRIFCHCILQLQIGFPWCAAVLVQDTRLQTLLASVDQLVRPNLISFHCELQSVASFWQVRWWSQRSWLGESQSCWFFACFLRACLRACLPAGLVGFYSFCCLLCDVCSL